MIREGNDLDTFFTQAPAMNPNRWLIKYVMLALETTENNNEHPCCPDG